MSGLSGGGWTTTLASACDVRILKSFPTAGTLPFYMPVDNVLGSGFRDWEQTLPRITASYIDMYILAGWQKQILNLTDACCFNFAEYSTGQPYADFVANSASSVGSTYSLTWIAQTLHEFNPTVITNYVLSNIP